MLHGAGSHSPRKHQRDRQGFVGNQLATGSISRGLSFQRCALILSGHVCVGLRLRYPVLLATYVVYGGKQPAVFWIYSQCQYHTVVMPNRVGLFGILGMSGWILHDADGEEVGTVSAVTKAADGTSWTANGASANTWWQVTN